MNTAISDEAGPPWPEMREALLSVEEVQALARDLEEYTHIHSTLCKGGQRSLVSPGSTSLVAAIDLLLSHAVPAIQVRYAYDQHEWTDTMLDTPNGVRLVRCRH